MVTRSTTALRRTAFHEAGHAVVSSAINDMPSHISTRAQGISFGRNELKMFARPSTRVQVYLAGFAAEHILTGRRSRHLGVEVNFAYVAVSHPTFREVFTEGVGLETGSGRWRSCSRWACRRRTVRSRARSSVLRHRDEVTVRRLARH